VPDFLDELMTSSGKAQDFAATPSNARIPPQPDGHLADGGFRRFPFTATAPLPTVSKL
jgi:hypothetical protein